jgi:hypothetical protein
MYGFTGGPAGLGGAAGGCKIRSRLGLYTIPRGQTAFRELELKTVFSIICPLLMHVLGTMYETNARPNLKVTRRAVEIPRKTSIDMVGILLPVLCCAVHVFI